MTRVDIHALLAAGDCTNTTTSAELLQVFDTFPLLLCPAAAGDGTNDNFSWNCGVEGPTDNPAVLALRGRQMRNLHLALMLSQGTPMVLAGGCQ